MAAPEPSVLLVECPHCGVSVPAGVFCGNCGAHLSGPGGRARTQHYAAAPGEHVAKMAVISTLFPHLPQRHAHVFREALLVGLLIVVLLGALQLYAPALLAAAVLLPVLYILYVYEVEVYQAEPVTVLAATFAMGAALGVAYTLVVGQLITGTLTGTQQGPVITAVVLPIVMQALMLAGPLLLLWRPAFRETLDGLTFGVSTAVGFTFAAVVASYWHVLTAPLQGPAAVSTEEIAGILRAAILAALVNAGATGMIAAAVWAQRGGRSRRRHSHAARSLPATLAVGFGAQITLALASYFVTSLLLVVVLWAVGAAVLLVWLRVLLHHALLDEGEEMAMGPPSPCPECHRLVPTLLFCPACGVARSATPKHSRPSAVGSAS